MNILYISDLFVQICKHIDNTKDLLQLELLSSHHKSIIRNTKWDHFIVKIRSEQSLENMLLFHFFPKLDLSNTDITDESVSKLINCHTLNLSYTNVTDKSVLKLINCHTLNLSYTNVTDESVSKLIKCHTLDLSYTNVTDKSVLKLINCHTLNLSGTKVTDKSVSKLIVIH